MIADCMTLSRVLFSLLLLMLSPDAPLFGALYLACGLSDILDGFLARRLHTESDRGARLDSAADLVFALAYAVKLLPLFSLPRGIWIWTGGLAVVKLAVILWGSRHEHRLSVPHSPTNRLTGLLAFLLPLALPWEGILWAAVLVCAVATVAVGTEISRIRAIRNRT